MRNFIQLTGAASLLALASPAFAQEAADSATQASEGQGADIVVTAQRRSERVIDVPISITVASAAQLERQQVNTVNDLNRIAPSLEIQSSPGSNVGGGGSIRGIGTQTFNAGAVASVGLVVDEVSQGNANLSELFDIDRVEILKGPQGTLFGLTTSAGVINITTNAPDPRAPSMRLRTELSKDGAIGSRFGTQLVQAVANLPTGTDSALRLAGSINLRQGVTRNTITGGLNDSSRYALRGRYLWKMSEALSLNLIADYSHTENRGGGAAGGDFYTVVQADAQTRAQAASCGVTIAFGNRDFCTARSLAGTRDNFGASLQIDGDLGWATLTSVTALRKTVAHSNGGDVFSIDPLTSEILPGATRDTTRLITQEIRLSSVGSRTLDYTVGGFFSHQRTLSDPSTFNIFIRPFPGLVINPVSLRGASLEITDRSWAVFGQATLHVTPALRLIAGGRYTGTNLSLNRSDLDAPVALARSTLAYQANKASFRLGAQYDLGPQAMAYATVSRGFKGAQIAVPGLPASPYVVRPEIPTSYEGGLKANLFHGWLVDFNLFYTNVHDYQAQACTLHPITGAPTCVQVNIDGVTTRGAELSVFGKITPNLSLSSGFIYAKATYPDGFRGTDGLDLGGKQLAYAPEYKFTFSGEYEQSLGSVDGFIAADGVWKSRLRFEQNSLASTTFAPHWIVGGRIGLRTQDERFSLAIFARNLFDVHEPSQYLSRFPNSGDPTSIGAIYGPQSFRQIGLSLDMRF